MYSAMSGNFYTEKNSSHSRVFANKLNHLLSGEAAGQGEDCKKLDKKSVKCKIREIVITDAQIILKLY